MNNETMENAGNGVLQKNCKKVTVTLQLDSDVINWFIKQGNENEHINNSLRKYIEIRKKQQEKLTDIQEVKEELFTKKFGHSV